uniref:Coiled-coil domain-containing protein 77 n=1 Tax=Mesocestoides corti TaxID=53468 RepID=A0A5K3FF04_MESCO
MTSAKMDLSGLESEYQCSQLYLKQVRHVIHLVKEQVPEKIKLEGMVRGLIQELIGIRARKAQLIACYEDPDWPGRLRLLGGVDPSQSELWVILGKLERRLASKEEDLAEKNLTYEAICRMVDALQVRTDANRENTLTMATQVNCVQRRILKLRKRLETKYAELIIANSERSKLQQLVGVRIAVEHI